MAFPSSLDSFVDKIDNTDDVLSAHINSVQDSIETIEAKVGVNSSSVNTSLDYLVKNSSSVSPGHKHVLADGASDITISYTRINDFLDSAITTAYSTMDGFYTNFYTSGRKIWLYENTAPTGWSIEAVTDRVLAVKGGSNDYNTTGGTEAGTWTQTDHTHTVSGVTGVESATIGFFVPASGTSTTRPSINHYHNINFPTGNGATANTYRPYAAVGIIISKD